MHFILDHLDQIEATVPGLAGRLDRSRIAAVGHSMGGHTVGMLAGMRVTDPHDGQQVNLAEPRIKAGVLIGALGKVRRCCGLRVRALPRPAQQQLRRNDDTGAGRCRR